jgi:hypothetical protein
VQINTLDKVEPQIHMKISVVQQTGGDSPKCRVLQQFDIYNTSKQWQMGALYFSLRWNKGKWLIGATR